MKTQLTLPALERFYVLNYSNKLRNLVLIFLFQCLSIVAFSQCITPDIPVIIGPISLCGSTEFPIYKPVDYYIWSPASGINYTWNISGGNFTSGNTGDRITVQWGSGAYSLSVISSIGCEGIIYMNDCDCQTPDGVNSSDVVVDLNEMDHIHSGILDLNHIANIIDPSGAHIVVSSNNIYVHDYKFFIRGQFNIETIPIFFEKCTIYMDKGSIIRTPINILPGNSFSQKYDNSTLQGTCNYMWQGIWVRTGDNPFIMESTNLSDAEYGIKFQGKTDLRLIHSSFFRNYISVYCPPSSVINHLDVNNTHNNNIESCDFDGSQTLPPNRYLLQSYYAGQYPPNGLHSTPQDNKAFAAMELNDLNRIGTVSIPFSNDPFPTYSPNYNYFHDLNVGILGNRSDIDIFNCHFENIASVGSYDFYGNFNGSAIYATKGRSNGVISCNIGDFNTSSDAMVNTFTNTYRAILLEKRLSSSIIANQIDNNSYVAIEVRRSLYGLQHEIKFNVIHNTLYGILSNINKGIFHARSNEITTVLDPNLLGWGIAISDLVSTTSYAEVTDNLVTCQSQLGIFGRNNFKDLYQNNSVTMDNSGFDPTGLDIRGFHIVNSNGNTVDCNYSGSQYSGTPNYFTFEGRSFQFENSPSSIVSCNDADQNKIGYEFFTGCNSSQFYGNKMYYLNDGLLLGDYGFGTASVMGSQGVVFGTSDSPGNKFFGTDNAGTFGHDATFTINNILSHSLWVNTGIYYPNTNNTSGMGSAIVPIIANGYTPYSCGDCGNTGGGGEQERAEAIALNTNIPNSFDQELLKWDSEKKLYEELKTDPTLIHSSVILENYMDTTQYNNKGRFAEITNELRLISKEQSTGVSAEDIQSHIDEVKTFNENITPLAIYEESQKAIDAIILNTIANDRWDFTDNEWNSIVGLANSCPFVNGPAVYEARALANSVDVGLVFDDKELCNNSNLKHRNTIVKKNIFSDIYPNPATNRFTVNVSFSESDRGTFQILNSLGALVFSKSVNGQNDLTDIDIHAIPNGIYSCHLIFNSLNQLIGKLSIVH